MKKSLSVQRDNRIIRNKIVEHLNVKSISSQPGAILPTWGHLIMSRDILCCHDWGRDTTNNKWVEARDTADHHTMYKTAPTTKNYSTQSVNSAKDDKPYLKDILRDFVTYHDKIQIYYF